MGRFKRKSFKRRGKKRRGHVMLKPSQLLNRGGLRL